MRDNYKPMIRTPKMYRTFRIIPTFADAPFSTLKIPQFLPSVLNLEKEKKNAPSQILYCITIGIAKSVQNKGQALQSDNLRRSGELTASTQEQNLNDQATPGPRRVQKQTPNVP